MSEPSPVFAVKIKSHDRAAAMQQLVELTNPPTDARRIAVKLNLCDYRRPETGAVSHPEVVSALLQVLRHKYPAAEISLYENDSSDTLVQQMWGYLGLDKIAAAFDARCVNLPQVEWVTVPVRGVHFQELEVPKLLLDADLHINHPKLKTHGKTQITCALKNMFGCYRPKDKGPYHKYLDAAIVDVNMAIRTHLTIVDADLCVEGNRGPTRGLPKRVGLFIGGRDSVAVDAMCAELMGLLPGRIGHIRQSAGAGLGSMQYDLQGDVSPRDFLSYRFEYSQSNLLFMQVVRRVMSWSGAG
jgi:uncharacterized protein (DUF362 family)